MRQDGVFRRPLAWLKEKSPGLHRFLTRLDKPYPMVREAMAIGLFIILGVSLLWGITGQEFGRESPVVVIESGSMMHCDQGSDTPSRVCAGRFGRIGTIDPGDLVFVQDVDKRSDVETWAQSAKEKCRDDMNTPYLECGCAGVERFGACGDVIIYRPGGDGSKTPIIHRALFWLDIHGDGTYSIEACDLDRVQKDEIRGVCIERLGAGGLRNNHGLDNMRREQSGFITRGDNNGQVDQAGTGITPYPVQVSHILGKARGEVPWVGLVKLFVSDLFGGTSNYANAPSDTKLMMWLTVGLLFGTPFAVETILKVRRNMRRDKHADLPDDSAQGPDGPPSRRKP